MPVLRLRFFSERENMNFRTEKISVSGNYGNCPVIDPENPSFSWACTHDGADQYQTAFRVTVSSGGELIHDSGWQTGRKQRYTLPVPLPEARLLSVKIVCRDRDGNESAPGEGKKEFLTPFPPTGEFIVSPLDREYGTTEFFRDINVGEGLCEAFASVACAGLYEAEINGVKFDPALLQPVHSNYSRQCYYTVNRIPKELFTAGKNRFTLTLGDGWRRNTCGEYLRPGSYWAEFFGEPTFSAEILLRYRDGREERIKTGTGGSWLSRRGSIVYANLFNGERQDEYAGTEPVPAVLYSGAPLGRLRPQTVTPITVRRRLSPVSDWQLSDGTLIYDLGENIAGFVEISVPEGVPEGSVITLRHSEEIDGRGNLSDVTLRGAEATDSYTVAAGTERVLRPHFTYHGFRYFSVACQGCDPRDIGVTALVFYTGIDSGSRFRCGEPMLNAIEENCLRTERDNIHGIATDCPQRDERMCWLNDATVRFEEMPYHFDIGSLFPKIADDIAAEQGEEGEITDTAPFIFGGRPACPVCSSYLITAKETYLHSGDDSVIRKHYSGFAKWDGYLESRSDNGILTYCNWGDWASPSDCCGDVRDYDTVTDVLPRKTDTDIEFPRSSITPGLYMATGYRYYNLVTLAFFASVLGKEDDRKMWLEKAEYVKNAFLERWYDPETGRLATGSQACQTLALWLGILPEDGKRKAFDLLVRGIADAGMRLTTGNLCSRYIFDVLTDSGRTDIAWELMTRREYPSIGFMIRNGATTVWERFELKENKKMNSHNHPMYAAVSYWFYHGLSGIAPVAPGFERFTVKPVFPEQLLYCECRVETPHGSIVLRWHRTENGISMLLSVPFGTEAEVAFDGKTTTVGSGTRVFEKK